MKGRVVRHQADRTNQKLYFTRVYCQLAEQTHDNQLKQAHTESAITHLYGSYLAFLQELSSFYGLKLLEPTLESIRLALETRTQVSPEIQRLTQAFDTDFLGEIYNAWQQVLYKPVTNAPAPTSDAAVNKLPIVDVMASQVVNGQVSTEMVRQWREDLLMLIESLRAGMLEY